MFFLFGVILWFLLKYLFFVYKNAVEKEVEGIFYYDFLVIVVVFIISGGLEILLV